MSETETKPAWTPPPAQLTWALPAPLTNGPAVYHSVTLRAATAGDVLKATAMRGASGMEVTLRLISAVSAEGVPYEVLWQLPAWMVDQMSSYLDSFNGAPMPSPLGSAAPQV
jgi:hypothetical protein